MIPDLVVIRLSGHVHLAVASFDARLTLAEITKDAEEESQFIEWETDELGLFLGNAVDKFGMLDISNDPSLKKRRWKLAGYHAGIATVPQEFHMVSCCIPYWLIVMPLTLSAYLLLVKPQPK